MQAWVVVSTLSPALAKPSIVSPDCEALNRAFITERARGSFTKRSTEERLPWLMYKARGLYPREHNTVGSAPRANNASTLAPDDARWRAVELRLSCLMFGSAPCSSSR